MVLWLGAVLVLAGAFLFAIEVIHPGALLLIPGTILLVAGALALAFNESVILSVPGILAIGVGIVLATYIQLLYYRRIAPTHRPMTTTPTAFLSRNWRITLS